MDQKQKNSVTGKQFIQQTFAKLFNLDSIQILNLLHLNNTDIIAEIA